MRPLAFLLWLGLACFVASADDIPPMRAIQAKYDLAKLDQNEKQRESYVMDLANLRWNLARHGKPGWEAIDAEIAKHPLPVTANDKSLAKLRAGKWISPRHDYLYRAAGTWIMDPDDHDPDNTNGTWAIHGNVVDETVATDPPRSFQYVIVLLDEGNFIFADRAAGITFYEKRPQKGGWPLRRDDPAP